MINGKKIVVVMPAYNAEKTLRLTYNDIPKDIVDEIIVTDDHSADHTESIARELGIKVIEHKKNLGYGGNQKTCYRAAIEIEADIVIMVHPDYQYSPKLIPAMAWMIASGEYDAVLGSRILGNKQVQSGMPLYKYFFNRVLTSIQNLLLGEKISEYHTGFRGFKKEILENLPLRENSNNFLFDNQMLAQILYFGYRIGEISCPTKYFTDASSISFFRSLQYGIGVLLTSFAYFLQKKKLMNFRIFNASYRKLKV